MKQVSLYDMHKATKAKILEWLPFELICDGEVIAVVNSHDMHTAKHDVHKATHHVAQANEVGKADFKKSLCRHGLIYCSICK